MRHRACLFLALACAGCDTPSLPMRNAPRAQVVVEGTRFTVHHTATRAEAVRTSPARHPDKFAMLALAARAMEAASGCTLRPGTLYGDQVMAEAFLDCPGAPQTLLKPPLTYLEP